jgi:predicted dehydrogenase
MKVAVLSSRHERAATYTRLLRDLPGVDLIDAEPDETFALRPDAVVVAGEISRRRELVERAADVGARVLCEQPLATKEADAQAMVDACAAAGVRLTLASPACFSPAFATVCRAIADDDVVGGLTTIHGAYSGHRTAGEPALGANAPYLLDMVDAVLRGEPAEQVYAQTNTVLSGRSSVESAALVTVRYASGTVAAIDCSWRPGNQSGLTMSFIGERASVEFNAYPRLLGGFDVGTAGARYEAGGVDLDSLMLSDFLAGAGNGPDGATGVRTSRIIEAAYESAHTGQPVVVVGNR